MVFNATFNNISDISWRSVLLVEETRRKLPTSRKSLTNFITYMLYRVHLTWVGFELTTLVAICTDCIGSCKSNYHTITATAAPIFLYSRFHFDLWSKTLHYTYPIKFCTTITLQRPLPRYIYDIAKGDVKHQPIDQ